MADVAGGHRGHGAGRRWRRGRRQRLPPRRQRGRRRMRGRAAAARLAHGANASGPRRAATDVHELVDLPAPASHRHLPPHLHLSIPAGVRLPQAVEAADRSPWMTGPRSWSSAGSRRPPPACVRAPWGCGETFVVERFAWADGVRVAPTPLIADALQTGTRRASPFGMVLGAAGLAACGRPHAGPTASPASTRTPPHSRRPVLPASRSGTCGSWKASAAPGGERLVRWMLLADRDFRVIGSCHEPTTTAATASTGPG